MARAVATTVVVLCVVATGLAVGVAGVGAQDASDGSVGLSTQDDDNVSVVWNHTDTGVAYSTYVGAVPAGDDGGFYAVGTYVATNGSAAGVQVVEFTSDGTLVERRLFSPGNGTGVGVAAVTPADGGGFYAVGEAATDAGGQDAFVARFDADGDQAWSRTHGGPAEDDANAVMTTDTGVVVVGERGVPSGTVGGQAWLFELSPDGDRLSNRTVGAEGWSPNTVAVDGDEVVVTGEPTGISEVDGWVVRTDGGTVVSNVTYTIDRADRFNPAGATLSDDGVVIAGTLVNGSAFDDNRTDTGALVTVDPATGATVVDTLPEFAAPAEVVPDGTGGHLVAGTTASLFTGGTNESVGTVLRVGADGAVRWRVEAVASPNVTATVGIDRVDSRLVATGYTDLRFPGDDFSSVRADGTVYTVTPPDTDLVDCYGGPDAVSATDVLEVITAYNDDDQVCGTTVSVTEVLELIAAYNEAS